MPETITVLLVDEDRDILEITATFLEREDEALEVRVSQETATALETIEDESSTVDCVISDYSMPGMSGIDFFREVRDKDPAMPFFFFTGRSRTEIDAELDEETLTGYVQKGTGTEQYGRLAEDIRQAVTE